MKKWIILILLFIPSHYLFSQPYDPYKINKKALAYYKQAMDRIQDGSLANAVGLLQQSIEADKNYVDAYLSLAGVYGQIKNYRASVETYEKAFVIDSAYTIEFKLPYSINLAGMAAQNVLAGDVALAQWNEIESLDPSTTLLLDVRRPDEREGRDDDLAREAEGARDELETHGGVRDRDAVLGAVHLGHALFELDDERAVVGEPLPVQHAFDQG